MIHIVFCLLAIFTFAENEQQDTISTTTEAPTQSDFYKKTTTTINGQEVQSESYNFNLNTSGETITFNGVEIDPNSLMGLSLKGAGFFTTLLFGLAAIIFVIFLIFFVGIMVIPILFLTLGIVGLFLLPSMIPTLLLVTGLYLLIRMSRNKKTKNNNVY